jgi:DUF1680 family protein
MLSLLALATLQGAEPMSLYKLEPVPFTQVKISDRFWEPRLRTNRESTIAACFDKCEETGRLSNFRRAGGLEDGPHQGIYYDDSDVFKVIEGAAYSLALWPDAELEGFLDKLISEIAAAQESDGYLYTARTLGAVHSGTGLERWSHLAHGHELYNVGHLYEAAAAHFQATGKRTLLDVALKNAELINTVFGPGPTQNKSVPGHEEIEIGLVKLFKVTGDRRWVDLSKHFVDMRGRKDIRGEVHGEYAQDHIPLKEQTEPVGHAVRAGYIYAGAADAAALTGDKETFAAMERIWENVVKSKLHITGGIGASRSGEAFGREYDLPNDTAYLETCAAVANALWTHRLFLKSGDARHMDVLERTIYNGFLSGVSLSGDRYFYPNPLASDGHTPFNHGTAERAAWFGTSCCPVNIVRFIPSVPGMIYAASEGAAWVSLYVGGSGKVEVDGQDVKLRVGTAYPWSGRVAMTVAPEKTSEFEVRMRIPGWARNEVIPSDLYKYVGGEESLITLRVNGMPVDYEMDRGYAVIKRFWTPGDEIILDMPMEVKQVVSHENVEANTGRVALELGPIVYCFEGADNGGEVLNSALAGAGFSTVYQPSLLGGVSVISAAAASKSADGSTTQRQMRAIPYHVWANRGANEMQVWMPASLDLLPDPTTASAARLSASHCYSGDTVQALSDGRVPKSSDDHGIPRLTFWDHKGTAEWLQYDFPSPVTLTGSSIYWFDDTGKGGCRLPESWKMLYLKDGEWHDLPGPFEVAKDKACAVTFPAVQAEALKIELQLQDGWSGGVLEWAVKTD